MRFFKFTFIILLLVSAIGGPIYYFYVYADDKGDEPLFEVETPERKDMKQEISATGKLKLKDEIKVGSVVSGRIKAVHVHENDFVSEGQLLVEIDDEIAAVEVLEAEGAYEKALADKEYHEMSYYRKKQLYDEGFLSDAELQEAKRDVAATQAEVKTLQASYKKAMIELNNHKVYAPASGVVIHVKGSKGERITSDLEEGELLSLVPDVQHIEAELEVSERDIGQVEEGLEVEMVVDTYPNKIFKSIIDKVSFSAKEDEDGQCTYQAKVYFENPNLLLRPGMSVSATINVASKDSVLTVTSRAFLIKKDHLAPIAEALQIPMVALDDKEKKALESGDHEDNIQYVWADCEGCFKELPVKIGITDHLSFEVISGLHGDERLVVDVMEDDEMKKIYDKFYRKL